MDVMDLIEKEGVLSPLQVLSILALNPKLPLHVAANYMSGILKVIINSCSNHGGVHQCPRRHLAVVSVAPFLPSRT